VTGNLIRFVDAASTTRTTRLDLNDEVRWFTREFNAPPARLRRNVSSNAMTDGVFVSSSSYDARTISITFDLVCTTQDQSAIELQRLARELDRTTNVIEYQPNGLTKPVFFKTYRSDVSGLVDFFAMQAYRQVTVEILAEPFAVGLRETISVGTVNNDPAAGSNGCYFDVTGVLGDVAAPMVLVDTGTLATSMILAVKQDDLSASMPPVFQEATRLAPESADTTNPGGGPDAVMSGAGTNNYLRTTFATTAADASRAYITTTTTTEAKAARGTHRVFVALRRSGTSATFTVHTQRVVSDTLVNGPSVVLPASSVRQLIDLGTVEFGAGDEISPVNTPSTTVSLFASRSGAAENLDWDCVFLVPADTATCFISASSTFAGGDLVLDGSKGAAYSVTDGTLIYTTGTTFGRLAPYSGDIPRLKPGVTNRLFYHKFDSATPAYSKSITGSVTIYYEPRYSHIRPIAS
jgi:hypothetical protein